MQYPNCPTCSRPFYNLDKYNWELIRIRNLQDRTPEEKQDEAALMLENYLAMGCEILSEEQLAKVNKKEMQVRVEQSRLYRWCCRIRLIEVPPYWDLIKT